MNPDAAAARRARRSTILAAVARAYLLKDRKAHLHPESVDPFWDGRPSSLPTVSQMRSAGAPEAALARLAQGGLGIDARLAPWTGGFFLGLKLSGALEEKEPFRHRIHARLHPDLAQDIGEWHLQGRLGAPDGFGRRRLVACPAASHLPAEDPSGASVVAGLFAGARLMRKGRDEWLELPSTDEAVSLLDRWTIRHSPNRIARAREFVKVSPFYAALFAHLMPRWSARRIMYMERPALCPLLPVVYWDWTLGPAAEGRRAIPFADALPFGCSRRTFYRHRYHERDLPRIAISGLGVVPVSGRLADLMRRWFDERQRLRFDANNCKPLDRG